MKDYNSAPAFSSFLPGIAGPHGCPMWVFYCNRGQCITSAGVQDKDGAILEFQPANKAYRLVSLQGFRTFLKIDGKFYEPFKESAKLQSEMQIAPDSFKIIEENPALKLKVEVTYFTLPGESFPALVRTLKITNLSPKSRKIELIDGLPIIIPHGFGNDLLKNICRTIEAWCLVENVEHLAPFYRLKVLPADVTETKHLSAGHFYLPFSHTPAKLSVIVDPRIVFGENSSLEVPANFVDAKNLKIPKAQIIQGFLPSAFTHLKAAVGGKATFVLSSLMGKIESVEKLNHAKQRLTSPKYIAEKFAENQRLIQSIGALAETKTASANFDAYCSMNFIDNVMRGGLPVNIDGGARYLYYRKHGDMERDYNTFKLCPTPMSSGSGNYRDINQNRRNDLFFNPDVGVENIIRFFSLVQLDGFNPLVVFEDHAEHGEGFWIDHFSYNTDLLESYESIYPDRMEDLLFRQKVFTFFENNHFVVPRRVRYRLQNGKVVQHESVRCDMTREAKDGKYQTTLMAKILSIIANKAASFDAEGIGLEMEADKPDWYDALNGLPGLIGSSLSETLELKRLCVYALRFLQGDMQIEIAAEIKEFIDNLEAALTSISDRFAYWDTANTIKEKYREIVKQGLSGQEEIIKGDAGKQFLSLVIKKCDLAVSDCLKLYGNYYTYFINEVIDYSENDDKSITVKKFRQTPLPLFLEGFVHALKVEKDQKIYQMVRKSPLFDKKLGMYKVNAPLEKAPLEIGRAKVFTPGWLENESIWLHMEYKYMLELLKAGMYQEFFGDFKKVLVPFMPPRRYGRSVLENSSFIVSSAHPDKSLHGRGFVARLSGSTAEFIDMWVIMLTGKRIFALDAHGKLCFRLSPILPAWLFKNGQLSFKLLGSIDVTYLNPKKKNTWEGLTVKSYKLILGNRDVQSQVSNVIEISGPVIPEPYASLIRSRKVKALTAILM